VLTGFGEPMLDKRLEEKVAYANGKGLSTYFITNGSALTPRRSRKLMDSGLTEMRVSFYGMRPETYNAVMQGLDFNRTLKGRARIPAAARRDGREDARADLLPRAPENKSDTDAFREFWVPR
jgi:molybdenum cofactor biosynthesis enzyme MoaA